MYAHQNQSQLPANSTSARFGSSTGIAVIGTDGNNTATPSVLRIKSIIKAL